MTEATYPIKKFANLRMYIAADMFRYMTSTKAKAYIRAWYIAGVRYTAAAATSAIGGGIGRCFGCAVLRCDTTRSNTAFRFPGRQTSAPD